MEANNIAAMRDALEKCANMGEQIDCQLGSSDETVYAFRHERCLAHNISECARAALAAPARNCDRFGDELDAQLAFLNEEWLIGVDRKTMLARDQFENWTCHMRSCYARWLMAPAAKKQKGEQNEEQSRN